MKDEEGKELETKKQRKTERKGAEEIKNEGSREEFKKGRNK